MYRFFLLPLDIPIGGVGGHGISTIGMDSGSGIIGTFADIFSSCFEIITGNTALTAILVVAVGAPILGAIVSILKGR